MTIKSISTGTLRNLVLRQLLGREAWALSDQAVVSATNFLTNVMLARFMGLKQFGIFALAWMAVLFVNSIQYALIVSPMMSIGPKQQESDRPAYYGAVVIQELCFVVLCFFLVLIGLKACGSMFKLGDVRGLSMPLAVSAFAYQLQDFIRRYFFAVSRGRHAFINDALSYLTQLPILYGLHMAGLLNSATALWTMAGTSIFGLIAGVFWMEPFCFNWEKTKEVSSHHWKISRWLGASALMQWTSGNLVLIAAPIYYGAAASGVLKASQNLMGATHVWFQGLQNVVPVEAARHLHSGGVRSMLSYVRAVLLKWGGLTLAFAILMSAAPGYWLRLLYGPQMAPYGYVLRLYALLYVIMFIGTPLRAGLQAIEFTVPIFWSYLVMTILSFALAVPLAKLLGLSGVMLGLLIIQVVFQGILAISLRVRTRRQLLEASHAA